MIDLLGHLDRLVSAASIEEVWKLHCEAMETFGFDRLLYGYTNFRTHYEYGSRDDLLILSNHDQEYVEKFIYQGMYFHSPMLKWITDNDGACSWSWVEQNQNLLAEEELKVIAFNQERGIIAGYTISFPDSSVRSKGVISLAGRPGLSQTDVDSLWEEHGTMINVLNQVAHLKIQNLPFTAGRPLTKRQREALEWVGDGKTVQDIATIMELTPATIEKHLRLAREALDVDTTAQAVLKASVQRQIYVVDN
ncbi:MAG: LuxR family transcriptional regulator [Rhodobacteraceae bacterium]|nr:LuxR family transcriptional regulator [Paracoccaceae bacterium]